jgi:predicted O-linked N-acetylglucosamine transferase (SPINDLY family)
VELVAFSGAPRAWADGVTARLRAGCRRWHEVGAMDDATLDALIRTERIDVLLELAGHTTGHRLAAIARKPAPVIVTAIGYPDTTGVPAIDLRLVDSITDPPGSDSLCTERPLRIDPCFLCYTPPIEAPEPAMPPAETPITFGSFNNIAKVVPSTVALWSRALRAVPDSRLLLKSIGLDDPSIRTLVAERFAREGIDPSRIDLRDAGLDRGSHLALYGQVHVALDPTPYNGTTTTCEALWMGVPVVTLQGHRHASRVSSSLLTACGCVDWIARDADSFTRIAAKLAADRESLARIRASLRGAMRASPLLDAPAYAQRLFAALAHLYSSLP